MQEKRKEECNRTEGRTDGHPTLLGHDHRRLRLKAESVFHLTQADRHGCTSCETAHNYGNEEKR